MNKKDMTALGAVGAALGILLVAGYLAIQIFYGVSYHIPPSRLICNLALALLVYGFLTMLGFYPEFVNQLPKDRCQGPVRKDTLAMVRIEKLLFMAALLVPSVSDALGHPMDGAYSLIAIGLMLVVALVFEIRIIRQLHKNDK